MYHLKSDYPFFIVFLIIVFTMSGCLTTEQEADPEKPENPQWIVSPPFEDEFVYGLGADSSLQNAKQKSIVSAGQQFSTRIKSIMEETNLELEGNSFSTMRIVTEQISDLTVKGTKFIEQYQADDGTYWVLSRVPLNCLIDMSEGMVLSYALNIKQIPEIFSTKLEKLASAPPPSREWNLKSGRNVPWTPKISSGSIRIDGNMDDWALVPVYYKGRTGDSSREGTDLDYLKVAMDDRNAYILAVTADTRWNSEVTFLMHFDFGDNPPDNRKFGYIDIESNFAPEYTNFWDYHHTLNPAYDPGGRSIRRGKVFEASIPLRKYDADRFNILLFNVNPTEENDIPYEELWIDELEAKRRDFINYSIKQ